MTKAERAELMVILAHVGEWIPGSDDPAGRMADGRSLRSVVVGFYSKLQLEELEVVEGADRYETAAKEIATLTRDGELYPRDVADYLRSKMDFKPEPKKMGRPKGSRTRRV